MSAVSVVVTYEGERTVLKHNADQRKGLSPEPSSEHSIAAILSSNTYI